MKRTKLLLAILVLMLSSGGSAWADRGRHSHFSLVVGPDPYWGPWRYSPYYYPPYYYPLWSPPLVIERVAPPVYIEQPRAAAPPPPAATAPAPAAAPPAYFWYFCTAAQAYYPYVKDCPGGWQKISPQPPGVQ